MTELKVKISAVRCMSLTVIVESEDGSIRQRDTSASSGQHMLLKSMEGIAVTRSFVHSHSLHFYTRKCNHQDAAHSLLSLSVQGYRKG